MFALWKCIICLWNRLFPSSKKSHFQNEAKCETFVVKMSFISMTIKNHFHINGFALNLALKVRLFGTRKWPIVLVFEHHHIANIIEFNLRYVCFPHSSRGRCKIPIIPWHVNKMASTYGRPKKGTNSCFGIWFSTKAAEKW